MKGINCDSKFQTAEHYSASQYEAISKSLDEFCQQVIDGGYGFDKYLYQQVIFTEWTNKLLILDFYFFNY